VAYEIAGVDKTGTMVNTDPGVANVLEGTDYEINSVPLVGTLTSTDPGVANVVLGTNYEINSVAKVGTLVVPVYVTELQAATLVSNPVLSDQTSNSPVEVTQGDDITFQFTAQDGLGNPVGLTGAMFSTQILGPNGQGVEVFPNSQHAIVDAPNGVFQLTLTEAQSATLGLGANKDIVTQIVIAGKQTSYRGQSILTVWPSVPQR
jgi:hypothetical protein